jgi:uncharacterized protein with NRDE domain
MAPVPIGLRSRGLAVRELIAADDPERHVAALDPTQYASMNLVWGDAGAVSIAYVRRDGRGGAPGGPSGGAPGGAPGGTSGGAPGGTIDIERLPRGIHVLCNDRLGADGFPRGVRLHDAIAAAPRVWPAVVPALEAALADHTRVDPPPSHLPPAIARELTAVCIHTPGYGTRSSTIFAAGRGEVIAYLHAEGPPCTTRFADQRGLL